MEAKYISIVVKLLNIIAKMGDFFSFFFFFLSQKTSIKQSERSYLENTGIIPSAIYTGYMHLKKKKIILWLKTFVGCILSEGEYIYLRPCFGPESSSCKKG